MSTTLSFMRDELRRNLELAPTTAAQRTKINDQIAVLERAMKAEQAQQLAKEQLVSHLQQVLGKVMRKFQCRPMPPSLDPHTLLTQIEREIDWTPDPAENYSELLGFAVHVLHDAALKANQGIVPIPKSTLYAVLCQVRDAIQKIPDPRVAPPPKPLDATLLHCQLGRARSLVADIAAVLHTSVNINGVTSPIRGLEVAYDLVRKEVRDISALVEGLDMTAASIVTTPCDHTAPAVLALVYDTLPQAQAAAALLRKAD